MTGDQLAYELCAAFCGELNVAEVPAGLAVSAMFRNATGDRVDCLVERGAQGWTLSDSGDFLGDLEASGVDIKTGNRAEFLARALSPAHAIIDEETLQITTRMDGALDPRRVTEFLVALGRAQDLVFWTRERVRSTFRDDAIAAVKLALGGLATIELRAPVDLTLAEFPADLVIRPAATTAGETKTAVYFAQEVDHLTEAMALAQELRLLKRYDVRVAALIEEPKTLTSAKAVRALNRIDNHSYYRHDEAQAVRKIIRTALPTFETA